MCVQWDFYLPSAAVFVGSILHSGKHIQVFIPLRDTLHNTTSVSSQPPRVNESLSAYLLPESNLCKGKNQVMTLKVSSNFHYHLKVKFAWLYDQIHKTKTVSVPTVALSAIDQCCLENAHHWWPLSCPNLSWCQVNSAIPCDQCSTVFIGIPPLHKYFLTYLPVLPWRSITVF